MQKRDFIKQLGMLSTGLIVPWNKLIGRPGIEIWKELVDYARWCPSPHNIQPWKLKPISSTEAWLFYDPARLIPVTDITSAFTMVGMGMFIECLRITAAPFGYTIIPEHEKEQQLDHTAKGLMPFARLQLVPATEKEMLDRELIKKRKTSRNHYDGRVLESELVQSLSTIAARYGHQFIHSSDREMVDFVLKLNRDTLFLDMDDDASRQEVSKWIRTTVRQAKERKDGLWSRCMRFPALLMHDFFYRHELFRSAWKRKLLGKFYLSSMRGTSNIGWMSGPFSTRNDWLNTGAMFQRFWLELTRHNVFLHPFGSVITNTVSHKKFSDRVGHSTSAGEIWSLVRLGYSEEPARSYRLDTDDILIA